MEQTSNPNMVPRGAGGIVGHLLRMIVCVCTGGMAFPRTFVEGMDLTAIQQKTHGRLYDKQNDSGSKTRF